MVLRFRYKSAVNVCQTLNSTNTVEHLKDTVAAITGLKPANVNLLVGYPPKPLKNFDNPNLTLGDLNIKSGETVIVETVNATPYLKCNQDIGPHPYISNQGTLIKKVVPADNSCLFTSVYFIVSGRTCHYNVLHNRKDVLFFLV